MVLNYMKSYLIFRALEIRREDRTRSSCVGHSASSRVAFSNPGQLVREYLKLG